MKMSQFPNIVFAVLMFMLAAMGSKEAYATTYYKCVFVSSSCKATTPTVTSVPSGSRTVTQACSYYNNNSVACAATGGKYLYSSATKQ